MEGDRKVCQLSARNDSSGTRPGVRLLIVGMRVPVANCQSQSLAQSQTANTVHFFVPSHG